jgi:D-serine deaminase-like pyridoxal phosphate-dependent protein
MSYLDLVDKPVLILDKTIALENFVRLAQKASAHNVAFRPHFKTHQSAAIGAWFRDYGITAVTVSSVDMALYFANHGWHDITIAFPINLRQLTVINELAQRVRLHLLLDSMYAAKTLSAVLTAEVYVWLEVDAGYQRTGLSWQSMELITAVARTVIQAPHLNLAGILTHAGNTYKERSKTAVLQTHHQTITRLKAVQSHLKNAEIYVAISIGDTPGCTLATQFEGIDEIRPGNFIFYDLMQVQIGACRLEDIAVAAACPVVGIYPDQQRIAIYGGAIHLSKETIQLEGGGMSYGRIALPTPTGWQTTSDANTLYSLSQEHGLIHATPELINHVQIGDLLLVLPIHSCLTANLLKRYLTLDGEWIEMANL